MSCRFRRADDRADLRTLFPGWVPSPAWRLASAEIATNDNWQDNVNAIDIRKNGLAPPNPSESALVLHLPAGPYTAIVRGTNGSTGVALAWNSVNGKIYVAENGRDEVPSQTCPVAPRARTGSRRDLFMSFGYTTRITMNSSRRCSLQNQRPSGAVSADRLLVFAYHHHARRNTIV